MSPSIRRSKNGADAARHTECGSPSEVKVATAAQHAELMQVLDDRLVATADVPGGVQMGGARSPWADQLR